MINHARTLLINRAYAGRTGAPGDEYVPPTYAQLALPTYLQTLRQQLFGTNPDTAMLNYRAWQLLSLIHSCELEEFITELDPRITYNTGRDNGYFNSFFTYTVNGIDSEQFNLLGTPGAPDASGRCRGAWQVTVTSPITATVTRTVAPLSTATVDLVSNETLSQAIDLPESGMQCSFRINTGSSWTVSGYARPQRELGELAVSLANIGSPIFLELFGVGSGKNQSEPFKTFYNLWRDNKELAYRLGGLVLAMIYRTNEIRMASHD